MKNIKDALIKIQENIESKIKERKNYLNAKKNNQEVSCNGANYINKTCDLENMLDNVWNAIGIAEEFLK